MTGGLRLRVIPVKHDRRLGEVAGARLLGIGSDASETVVVAGMTSRSQPRLHAVQAGRLKQLWSGERRLRRSPDLVRRTETELFCLVPDTALIRLGSQDGAVECEELITGRELPERLFAAGDALFAYYGADGLGPTIASLRITDSGGVSVDERRPAPPMEPESTISGLVVDSDGRLILTADNPRTGFRLWRETEAGAWTECIPDGAARFSVNAAVHDLVVWGDLVAIAAGSSRTTLDHLFGLRFPGEILLLDKSGSYEIACGETRTSRSGLKVPLAGHANAAAGERGNFSKLARSGERLVAVMQRAGDATVYTITPDFIVSAERRIPGIATDLALSRRDPSTLVVTIA